MDPKRATRSTRYQKFSRNFHVLVSFFSPRLSRFSFVFLLWFPPARSFSLLVRPDFPDPQLSPAISLSQLFPCPAETSLSLRFSLRNLSGRPFRFSFSLAKQPPSTFSAFARCPLDSFYPLQNPCSPISAFCVFFFRIQNLYSPTQTPSRPSFFPFAVTTQKPP